MHCSGAPNCVFPALWTAAVETAIGYVPKAEDINIEGLNDVTLDTIKELVSVDHESWKEDIANKIGRAHV